MKPLIDTTIKATHSVHVFAILPNQSNPFLCLYLLSCNLSSGLLCISAFLFELTSVDSAQYAQYGYTLIYSIQKKYHRSSDLYQHQIQTGLSRPAAVFFVGIMILWLVGLLVWGLAVDLNTPSSDKWSDNGQPGPAGPPVSPGETLILVAVVFTFH